jgi:alkylation response protein AidB-like acyl-CoA dehydrogenase
MPVSISTTVFSVLFLGWLGGLLDTATACRRSPADAPRPSQVNAFIVRKGTPGFRTRKIENKIALRCVQNADMVFDECFVPEAARLPGVQSFRDTNKVLAISRVMVSWLPVGMSMGVYDICSR